MESLKNATSTILALLPLEELENYIYIGQDKVLELTRKEELLHLPWLPLLSTVVVLYLSLVQVLRFHNLRKQTRAYYEYLSNPYRMNYKTAHPILTRIMLYEAPWMYAFSTQWALIKTYAVAPGTGLLVQTRQLTTPTTVGKRAEDTGVILTEFLVGSMDSERGSKALAKMNWLHRRYGTKIKQPELLHTLAMFVLEPIQWFEAYEWRSMEEYEQAAIYTYWKEIGNRMGISNIPPTLSDLKIWVKEYEKTNIYFTENNKKCAEATMGLFLRNLPLILRPYFQHAAVSLFEPHIRIALGYPEPPRFIAVLVQIIFRTRKFILRNLTLPRLYPLDPLPKPDKSGRLFRDAKLWAFEPWYVKATVSSWLGALFATSGQTLPGKAYKSNGFLVEELGPVEFEKVSKEPVVLQAEEMRAYGAKGGTIGNGCPFQPLGNPFNYGG